MRQGLIHDCHTVIMMVTSCVEVANTGRSVSCADWRYKMVTSCACGYKDGQVTATVGLFNEAIDRENAGSTNNVRQASDRSIHTLVSWNPDGFKGLWDRTDIVQCFYMIEKNLSD